MDTVGIVGLGVMGSNCAKKLMESGVPVAGYDPYPPAVKRASEAGVAVCGSPAELAGKARVILMFVPGPADTEKVVLGEGGIASGAPEGTVFLPPQGLLAVASSAPVSVSGTALYNYTCLL